MSRLEKQAKFTDVGWYRRGGRIRQRRVRQVVPVPLWTLLGIGAMSVVQAVCLIIVLVS